MKPLIQEIENTIDEIDDLLDACTRRDDKARCLLARAEILKVLAIYQTNQELIKKIE